MIQFLKKLLAGLMISIVVSAFGLLVFGLAMTYRFVLLGVMFLIISYIVGEIYQLFGGAEKMLQAVDELQKFLYE